MLAVLVVLGTGFGELGALAILVVLGPGFGELVPCPAALDACSTGCLRARVW